MRRAAYRLVDVDVPEYGAGFTYALNRNKLRRVRRREGRYLLRTNPTETDPVKLWNYYLQLGQVEEAFRTLKPGQAARAGASLHRGSVEPNAEMRDFVLLALLTGARRANVLAMRLQDVNLDRGEWRIPETKRGESQTVTLVPEAVEILRRRSAKFTGGEFVLPAKSKVGHLREPKSGWRRIFEAIRDLGCVESTD